MRLSVAGTLLACIATAQGFKNTSPFLLFSSSQLENASTSQLQSAASVLQTAKDFLSTCPSDIYIFVYSPSVSATDLSHHNSATYLQEALADPSVKGTFSVSEVVGLQDGSMDELIEHIHSKCGQIQVHDEDLEAMIGRVIFGGSDVWWTEKSGLIVRSAFKGLPSQAESRERALAANDANLYSSLLEYLPIGYKYTVIYTTTPGGDTTHESHKYEATFEAPFHTDLKRDLRIRADNSTNGAAPDDRPLFEKYQFLTPGLFMALFVTFILIAILSVGISGVASLQVSYGAFEKEMGPAAQKKAQ